MPKQVLTILLVHASLFIAGQPKLEKLSVEKIMSDPKWLGTSPSNPAWSLDGQFLFFNWNPDGADADSLYYITRQNHAPVKATVAQKQALVTTGIVYYSRDRRSCVYSKNGDIFLTEISKNKTRRVTNTAEAETDPVFSFNETNVVYVRDQNFFAWDIFSGETTQLTNFMKGMPDPSSNDRQSAKDSGTQEERWLRNDQLQNLLVIKSQMEKKKKADNYEKNLPKETRAKTIYIGDKDIQGLNISPDGRFISYSLFQSAIGGKATIVPDYVNETGYTMDLPARTKVGSPQGVSEFFIYNRSLDTIIAFTTDSLPGIRDLPDYVKDYPIAQMKDSARALNRSVTITGVSWSPQGKHAIVDIQSNDYKDRWLMLLDSPMTKLKLLDRQRDEAWLGGPGTGGWFRHAGRGWIDEARFWYQSEASGYSHLYSVNTRTGEKKALTSGNYEVQEADLSKDKQTFFLITNEVHPGEQQFYRLPVKGGGAERITTMVGANQVTLSPDEKTIAILYSYSNKPWELYLQENKPGAKAIQVTDKAQSPEFKSYVWRDPELITFPARDGIQVYARLYRPKVPDPHKPAVVFVHGAGYLQNAHKWWSYYYREFMFNNLLADNGYYVMDIDYRGSAGYGRDWRTAIYRHMGGKDLDDNVDAARFMVKTFGVDSNRIGIYGGSYGGFITLMALFTTPDVFKAGAALRPVTDWANYSHGYTSAILNEPYKDSLSYRRSSPFYYAAGLKNHLLMCHGMLDVNVHFQDVVKLSQRLIELGKDNWELAAYPMEDHSFLEPSSWTDEYKRVFRLFETVLKK